MMRELPATVDITRPQRKGETKIKKYQKVIRGKNVNGGL